MLSNAKPPQKTLCEKYQRRVKTSKIPSKLDVLCANAASKNRSTGTINTASIVKPKKTTKSDSIVGDKARIISTKPNCQACGDGRTNTTLKTSKVISAKCVRNSEGVQQHFRNKNFRQSSASMCGTGTGKKANLNTINEHSDEKIHGRFVAETIYSESGSEEFDGKAARSQTVVDGKTAPSKTDFDDKTEDIEQLKMFRRENYFECHSAAAKLKDTSAANLRDHRCVYRFYLNERLFPVPVRSHYNNVTRCTECHLPLEGLHKNINGTIQAKVKIDGQLQDMTLILPVNKSLIVKERRRDMNRREEDPLYFGIVRLSQDGDSVFRRNLPADSLALRYQRGYQEYGRRETYQYERGDDDDDEVIVV